MLSGTVSTQTKFSKGDQGARAHARDVSMAGRFQGFHQFPKNQNVEIFWQADGWWWWSRAPGSHPGSKPVGPFTTSTEAYLHARGGALLMPCPTILGSRRATPSAT